MEMNYLHELFRSNTPVRVFVSNGFQLRGQIDDISEQAIILCAEGKRKLIFIHAISTIEPI